MRVKTNKETLRRGRLVGPLSDRVIRILKSVVFAASLSPVAFLLWDVLTDQLNANPFNAIVRSSGFWSLRFLCLTLAITPLRWLTGWHSVVKFRRMFGLFGFFYATVHTAAYVLMAPLAATSTVGMIRRLGGRRWQALHRLAYPAAVASVLHTYWPLTLRAPRYAVILGIVFVLRVGRAYARRRASMARTIQAVG